MITPSATPEKFRGAASVSFTVKDIQKSLAWYHDVLGLGVERAVERDGKCVFIALKAGDVRISLNQDDGAKGWDRKKGQGFSVNIAVTEDIDAIANRIKASGEAEEVHRGGVVPEEGDPPIEPVDQRPRARPRDRDAGAGRPDDP